MTVCVQQMFIFKLQLSCFVFVGSEARFLVTTYGLLYAWLWCIFCIHSCS